MNERVRAFIESNLISLDDHIEVLDSDNIFEKGYVNSLFAMSLLQFVESEFNISIDTEDMDVVNFNSVDNIVKLIQKKRASDTL